MIHLTPYPIGYILTVIKEQEPNTMTANEITTHVVNAKQQGFTPTQTRMQLAMLGATNEQIKAAVPSPTEWMVYV